MWRRGRESKKPMLRVRIERYLAEADLIYPLSGQKAAQADSKAAYWSANTPVTCRDNRRGDFIAEHCWLSRDVTQCIGTSRDAR